MLRPSTQHVVQDVDVGLRQGILGMLKTKLGVDFSDIATLSVCRCVLPSSCPVAFVASSALLADQCWPSSFLEYDCAPRVSCDAGEISFLQMFAV